MKRMLFLLSSVLACNCIYGQKEISGIAITEGSKLILSAKAETVSNVTLIITPSIEFDKNEVGFEFPYKMDITLFSEKTFKDNLRDALLKIYEYQKITKAIDNLITTEKWDDRDLPNTMEKLLDQKQKKEIFDSELISSKEIATKIGDSAFKAANGSKIKEILKGKAEFRLKEPLDADFFTKLSDYNSTNELYKYKARAFIDERLNTLFIYFDSQIATLFKYDTEPVAGTLFYKTDIGQVRYFQNQSYETYYNNRTRNYHDIIKKLYLLRSGNSKEQASVADTLKKYYCSAYTKESTVKPMDSNPSNKETCDISEQLNSILSYLIDEKKLKTKIRDSINRLIIAKNIEVTPIYLEIISNEQDIIYLKNRVKYSDLEIRDLTKQLDSFLKRKALTNTSSIKKKIQGLKDTIASSNEDIHYFKESIESDKKKIKDDYEELGKKKNDFDEKYLKIVKTNKSYLKQVIDRNNNDGFYYSRPIYSMNYVDKASIDKYSRDKGIFEESTDELDKEINEQLKDKKWRQLFALKNNQQLQLKVELLKKIENHFSNKAKEYRTLEKQELRDFLKQFNDLVENFRIYNRGKRMQLIYDKLLRLEHDALYDTINSKVDKYYGLKDSINSIDNKLKLDSLRRKVLDFKSKIADIDKQISSSERDKKVYELQDLIERYEKGEKSQNTVELQKQILDLLNGPDDAYYHNDYFNKKTLKDLIDEAKMLKSSLPDGGGEEVSSKLNTLNTDKSNIENNIRDINKEIEDLKKAENNNSEENELYAPNQFYDEEKEVLSDSIRTSNVSIKEKIESFEAIKQDIRRELKRASLWDFKAVNIELDFNDGFIEHIVMEGHIVGISSNKEKSKEFNQKLNKIITENPDWDTNINKQVKFDNVFPYGFSSTKDFDDFKSYDLASYTGKHREFEIRLEEIFPNYVQRLQNDRLNFSPKDGVVTLPEPGAANEKVAKVELKKEISSRLFNLSVYSDFIGLSGNPNGLLQFEFNKPIPLYTKRKTWLFGERYLNRGFNYGIFNYINPQFRWARLDAADDVKNLKLTYLPVFEGGTEISKKYVTQLDLLRYENIAVGADLNVFSFDFPTAKWRLEINTSGRYGRTKVLDTKGGEVIVGDSTNIIKSHDVNTWRFYPEFIFRLRPEERYGASLSFRPMRFNTVTTEFSNISSESQFTKDLTDVRQWLNQFEIQAHYSPSGKKDNRFFFRYRYTNNAGWEYNGFSEIQIGYSMALRFNSSN